MFQWNGEAIPQEVVVERKGLYRFMRPKPRAFWLNQKAPFAGP